MCCKERSIFYLGPSNFKLRNFIAFMIRGSLDFRNEGSVYSFHDQRVLEAKTSVNR